MKKFASILVSALLVLALMVPAFATGENLTITISNTTDGHTYEAYQVFAGRLEGDVLSDITWGTGVDGAAVLAALKADTTFGTDTANAFYNCTTAAQVADVISNWGITAADDARAIAVAKAVGAHLSATKATSTDAGDNYTITGLDAGYYLVKDQNASLDGDYDAYTRYILEVVKNVTVTPKSSVPTVEKKVSEGDYASTTEETAAYGDKYNDVADYNIGDTVPFEFIGTVSSTYADYTTYEYTFHDTMSAGLTFDAASVQVFVGDTYAAAIGAGAIAATNYTVVTTGLADGCTFEVHFADLKNIAAVTATSKIIVKYNGTLNTSADIGLDGNPNEVYLEYSNNPNGTGTGETTKDKVIVFTYELDTTKVDAANNATKLQGAQFKLYKTVDGTDYYATVTDGKITNWTATEATATVLTSDANGLFTVAGIEDGTYYLKETVAPTGYNLLDHDVEVVITATTVNGQTWDGTASTALTNLAVTADTVPGTATAATGIANITIENSNGSTLPSTGGMGTTIFTVVGIVLMLGAAVVLIARRKVTANAAA